MSSETPTVALCECEASPLLLEAALQSHFDETISDCDTEPVPALLVERAGTPPSDSEYPKRESPAPTSVRAATLLLPKEREASRDSTGKWLGALPAVAGQPPGSLRTSQKWISEAATKFREFSTSLPGLAYQGKFELLAVVLFAFLAITNHRASSFIVFLVMEVLFDLSLVLALLFKTPRFRHFGLAFSCFLLNRFISLAMPTAVLVYAIVWKEFGTEPWVTYTVVAVDYVVTVFGFFVFFEYFMPVRVRAATEQDLEGLREIERVAFPEEDQQASEESILKRIRTAPGTVLIAELFSGEAVGSLYLRPVNLAETEAHPPSWEAVANGSDFTYQPGHHDALYAVGLQGKPASCKGVSTFLLSEAMACLLRMKLKAMLGGLRVPQYHSHPEMPLQEYVHSGQERLLGAVLQSLPQCTRPTVVCGVEGYWPTDKDSLGCAALVAFHNPIHGWPQVLQHMVASSVVRVAQCAKYLSKA
eukprot:RCo054614